MLAGIPCPLTVWERRLRRGAPGRSPIRATSSDTGLIACFFIDAEPWVFTVIYMAFGLAVLAAFILAPPAGEGNQLHPPATAHEKP